MKKMILGSLALALAFAFVSCGGGSEASMAVKCNGCHKDVQPTRMCEKCHVCLKCDTCTVKCAKCNKDVRVVEACGACHKMCLACDTCGSK